MKKESEPSITSRLIAFLGLCLAVNSLLRTANPPVRLNLHRLPPQTNITQVEKNPSLLKKSRPSRTKPSFFKSLLELIPGREFDFHLPKWKAIQRSGLFYNLTAKTEVVDGNVMLNITGIELPSISFAPEVSVSPSLDDPRFSGGLVYRDKNFRGLGETLEVVLNRKEGVDLAIGQLPMTCIFQWTDCNIGKSSTVSAKFESEGIRDYAYNLQTLSSKTEESYSTKVSALTKRLSAKIQGMFFFGQLAAAKWTMEPYKNFLQPLEALAIRDLRPVVTTGAKLLCEFFFMNDLQGCIWHNQGYAGNKHRDNSFQQIGADLVSPTYSYPFQIGESTKTGGYELLGKIRLAFMRAWGKGCLPQEHYYSLGNSRFDRGFHSSSKENCNTIHSLASMKTDGYVNVKNMVIVGLFNDLIMHNDDTSEVKNRLAASVGCSLRSQGIRVDVGFPITTDSRPRIHLSFDYGA